MFHPMLYHFRYCAHYEAGFIIFTQLTQLRIFFIISLVLPIVTIVATPKGAQIITHGVQHLLKCCFWLCGCQSHVFSISHIFLILLNCCLCVFNSPSCRSGVTSHIILYRFLLLFIAEEVSFTSFSCCKLLFGSQVAQCSQGSDPFCR